MCRHHFGTAQNDREPHVIDGFSKFTSTGSASGSVVVCNGRLGQSEREKAVSLLAACSSAIMLAGDADCDSPVNAQDA